jgi:hypothetical protein
MSHRNSAVVWTGPQSARPIALEHLVQFCRLMRIVLDAQLPDGEAVSSVTLRGALHRNFGPELPAMIEGLARAAESLDDEQEVFDGQFDASARGAPAPGRAPELRRALADINDRFAAFRTFFARFLRDAALECAGMDSGARAIMAGRAKAQRHGNMIVRRSATPANRGAANDDEGAS